MTFKFCHFVVQTSPYQVRHRKIERTILTTMLSYPAYPVTAVWQTQTKFYILQITWNISSKYFLNCHFQVSNSVKTNSSFKQWVSLGDLSRYTCFPKPSTCGPGGASLSVWMKIEDCVNGQNNVWHQENCGWGEETGSWVSLRIKHTGVRK